MTTSNVQLPASLAPSALGDAGSRTVEAGTATRHGTAPPTGDAT